MIKHGVFSLACMVLICFSSNSYAQNSEESDTIKNPKSPQPISMDLSILQDQYESMIKEEKIRSLTAENAVHKAKRNLMFFYFLTFAGISFTATIVFYLRAKKNKLLLEKEKEIEKLTSKFFENISHELRTPLSLILSPLSILHDKVTEDDRYLVEVTQQNAKKLLNLVNQFLDISKIDAGKMELMVNKANIIPLIKSNFYAYQNYANNKKIILSYHSDFEAYKIYYNQDMIEKIISNILSNAVKYTPENGMITVHISEENFNNKKYLTISVSDTGMGIAEESLPYLFNRFYCVDKDKTEEWSGTGIGLSLVKELVELHYGKIEVESELCVGTTFKVFMPVGRQHLNDSQIDIFSAPEEEKPNIEIVPDYTVTNTLSLTNKELADEKPVVLVVDDNVDMRTYLRQILSKKYRIIESANGKSGIEKAIKYCPDLIVCDVKMPKANGYELCNTIKSNNQTKHIPIIILTGKNNSDDKLTSLKLKADSFLSKPFKTKELLFTIENLISLRIDLIEHYGTTNQFNTNEKVNLKPMDQEFLEKILIQIDKNISNESFGVEELSQVLGVSRSKLQRKIKKILHCNPNQLIKNYRLDKALVMLRNKVATISEVSFMVGYSSHSYFTKCFLEKFGYTPNEVKADNTQISLSKEQKVTTID